MPIIGFPLDFEQGKEHEQSYSRMPHYAIRENYLTSISELGGIPLPLPHNLDLLDTYLEWIDGLVIIGGGFDIPPALYGDNSTHETVKLKESRTQFEWAMTEKAIAAKKPILGICGGEQLLNVVLGGTLVQHIPDSFPHSNINHEQAPPFDQPGHVVKVATDTLLHRIVGKTEIHTNTSHHQAVGRPAPGCVINATTEDGVIEGIEYPNHPFCLGVQWHPEYQVSAADTAIFHSFIAACQ